MQEKMKGIPGSGKPWWGRRRRISILAVSFLVGMFAFGFLETADEFLLKIYRGIEVFGRVYTEGAINYVDDIDPDAYVHAGIDGMLKTLDP